MTISGDQLIEAQQKATGPTSVTFADGRSTTVFPGRTIAATDAPALSLDGTWKVRRWPFGRKSETHLAAPATDDQGWEEVCQPGKVFYADPDAEGGEIKDWNRVTLSHIDPEDGAVLRRTVTVPKEWKGKRVFLRFDGIFPAGRVYLDGALLGEHLSGLTPVEYDVTGRVKPGRPAVVAVRLIRRHTYVKMDMVRHACEFGGLAQSACFHAVEPVFVKDFFFRPEVNARLTRGTLAGTVYLRNTGARGCKATLKLALTAPDGRAVGASSGAVAVPAAGEAEAALELAVPRPLLWNDEHPHLYTATLTVSVAGQAKQTLTWRPGFRRFELSSEGPKLNGNPVKFRGVNHLTFHPEHGMHTPVEWLRRNLALMKKANVNAIRTHYLGPRTLAPLCDEMGVYLLQELPIDWGTDYIADVAWTGPAMHRIEAGVRRDRHSPSVMVWSVGNENMPNKIEVAADGWNHLAIYDRFVKRLDPSRPTMFPPPGPANKIEGILELRVGDIADTHYSFKLVQKFTATGACVNPNSWENDMVAMTKEEALKRGWSGVWFSSEYGIFNMIPDLLNAPYSSIITDVPEDPLSRKNSLQAFQDRHRREWGLMRDDPTCLGGAYFPWICAGAGGGDWGNPWGYVRWGEDADWGPVCADLTPKPFFWAMRVLFSPVWFPEHLIVAGEPEAVRFTVQNQFNDIDLKDCTLRVQQNALGTYGSMMRKFRDVPMRGRPGETVELAIPLDPGVRGCLGKGNAAVCRCHLMRPDGFRVITHDLLLIPEAKKELIERPMPIGPDAVL